MKYTTHPLVVDAYKIKEIIRYKLIRLENDEIAKPTKDMIDKVTPTPGDYWVIQKDGSKSIHPKKSFEEKYYPMETS